MPAASDQPEGPAPRLENPQLVWQVLRATEAADSSASALHRPVGPETSPQRKHATCLAEKRGVTYVLRDEGLEMAGRSSFWTELQSDVQDPEYKREYERAAKIVAANNALIIELNEMRELQEQSKKDLAMAAGLNPAAVRRLFTQERGNPTLTTVSAVAQALGYRLALVPIDDEVPARAVEGASGSGTRR